jgi:hypothetical protein
MTPTPGLRRRAQTHHQPRRRDMLFPAATNKEKLLVASAFAINIVPFFWV